MSTSNVTITPAAYVLLSSAKNVTIENNGSFDVILKVAAALPPATSLAGHRLKAGKRISFMNDAAANTYGIAVQKDCPVAVSDALVVQGD